MVNHKRKYYRAALEKEVIFMGQTEIAVHMLN